jgi:hypothetical protein
MHYVLEKITPYVHSMLSVYKLMTHIKTNNSFKNVPKQSTIQNLNLDQLHF